MSPKLERQLTCRKCKTVIPWGDCNQPGLMNCRKCRQSHQVEVFPALFAVPKKGQAAESLLSDEDASCFFHELKKADSVCDACGRFLCKLCAIDLADMTTCSACLETGRKSGEKVQLMSRTTRYDMLSFTWSIVALSFAFIVFMASVFTDAEDAFFVSIFWAVLGSLFSCIALYYGLRYRKKAISVLPVSGWRYTAGLSIAGVSLAGILLCCLLTFMEI